MKKLFSAVLVTSIAFSAIAIASAATSMKCPSCGMAMPTAKSATMTVPVKVKGVTYYCCPKCPSGQKAAKAPTK